MTPEDERLIAAARVAGLPVSVPDAQRTARAERGVALVREVLGDRIRPDGVRVSPLGPGWSRDVDVHVMALPGDEELLAAGWLPLDGLLRRLGRRVAGRWAVVDDTQVVAAVDLHLSEVPDPVEAVLRRARRSAAPVREALELRALLRQGHAIPDGDPGVAAAARVEALLPGSRMLPGAASRPGSAAAVGSALGRGRRVAGATRSRTKPRVVVALTGVDGAGKSTVAAELAASLDAAAVVHGRVWARPGLGLRGLSAVARLGKRMLREDPAPGVRRMAADPPAAVRSRRGLLGWSWSLAITLAFLANVWRQHLSAQGVVIYDRHLFDALATLDVLYRGTDLRLQRALVRRCLPRADVSLYLDIPAEVAVARKPGDTIGAAAVAAQLQRYRALLDEDRSGVVVVDATQPPEDTAMLILRRLSGV